MRTPVESQSARRKPKARRSSDLAARAVRVGRPSVEQVATAELVKSSRNPAFVVFNAGPPRGPLIYRDAAELITGVFGLVIAPVVLPERAAFHHSAAAGRTAPEHDTGGKAADEIQRLWAWTCEQLGMSTRGRVGAADFVG